MTAADIILIFIGVIGLLIAFGGKQSAWETPPLDWGSIEGVCWSRRPSLSKKYHKQFKSSREGLFPPDLPAGNFPNTEAVKKMVNTAKKQVIKMLWRCFS